ncbi:sulfotransferase [Aestuariivirga sp.]|uniref:sulfotransferase family protein n=1 Tax=Aestuariivirga sp. TaxID=2650926 RepID=UPI003019FAB7
MSKSTLIHIGMHKTGSSWLQVNLFTNPESRFWNAAPASKTRRKSRAKFGSDLFYRSSTGNVLLEDEFNAHDARHKLGADHVPEGRCMVVSHERLSGHPMSNGIDRAWICRRLHATFPDGKVLLVVREQRSIILSNYMQYLKYGGARSIQGYLFGENDARSPTLTPRYWRYHELARLYLDAFGAANVLVLPYEMLRRDPADFAGRICRFAGVEQPPGGISASGPENASQNYLTCVVLRWISPLIRSSRGNGFAPALFGRRFGQAVHLGLQKYLGLLVPRSLNEYVKRNLLSRVESVARENYPDSNQRLQEMTGLELGQYGYLLPDGG